MIKCHQFRRIRRWNNGLRCHRHSFSSLIFTPIAEVDTGDSSNDDLADIIRPYFEKQTPVVLRGATAKAPAIHRWPNLTTTWGHDLSLDQRAAVEIGGSYSSTKSDRAEIPIHNYLDYLKLFEERHGRQGSDDPWKIPADIPSQSLVYMAQNDLPQPLYKDIDIPTFCQDERYRVGNGRLYSVMLWLGPRACVSPLHFDPLDNILMQFVGRKVVWLFDPNVRSMWHYAGHEGQQSNTSPVNPEEIDNSRYPLFIQNGPPSVRTVLQPGDMLYIPSKWWHFVRSVDTSASVNVWWR